MFLRTLSRWSCLADESVHLRCTKVAQDVERHYVCTAAGASLQTSCDGKPSSLWCLSKPHEALFRERADGAAAYLRCRTQSPPRTWGLSAGGGDVIRIIQLWQRKWSEHASIPAKNWCCWFERMLPDGKTDRVRSECIQSHQYLCHRSQVRSWNRANKLSGWRQVVKLQFNLGHFPLLSSKSLMCISAIRSNALGAVLDVWKVPIAQPVFYFLNVFSVEVHF